MSSAAYQCTLDVSVQAEDLIRIAREAGQAILNIYNGDKDDWEVKSKSDSSPLTRADQDANAIICDALARIAPHVPIISEENKAVDYAVRRNFQVSFCVDPLDGTKEFLKRNGQFTVNIALLRGGRPVMGVVHTPCEDRTHWAVAGQGAYVREAGSTSDARIHAAQFSETDAGITVVGSASHSTPETEAFIAKYKDPKFKALGSSLKFMLVAEGKAHVYPRLAPTCEWDTAASQIIVEEAGGEVFKHPEGTPMVYNKENPLNPYFVVYGKRK
eukprot:jgi/Mesvir1/2980/Mv09606-RA.1